MRKKEALIHMKGETLCIFYHPISYWGSLEFLLFTKMNSKKYKMFHYLLPDYAANVRVLINKDNLFFAKYTDW